MSMEKTCTRCGFTCDRADAPAHFYAHHSTRDGFQTMCKACQAEYRRSWKRAHPNRCAEYARRYRARVNAAREAALQDALAAIRNRKGA